MITTAIALLIVCFVGLCIAFFLDKAGEGSGLTFAFGMLGLLVAFIFFLMMKSAVRELDDERNHAKYVPVNEVFYKRVDSTKQ